MEEDILKQFRDPLVREDAAREMSRMSVDELKARFESIRSHQERFVKEELAGLYGGHVEQMLTSYFRKFGAQGHGTYVAVDDCDLAVFGRGPPAV